MNRYGAGVALLLAAPAGVVAQRLPQSAVPAAAQQSVSTREPQAASVTWAAGPGHVFVAQLNRRGVDTRVSVSASGNWIETSTAIGAISLPEAVRKSVLANYRGYRFVDTRMIDRASPPVRLYEVTLDRGDDTASVRYQENGTAFSARAIVAPPPPYVPLTGGWRGVSHCLRRIAECQDEDVIYHVTISSADSNGYDIETATLAGNAEQKAGLLVCTLDRKVAITACIVSGGVWRFVQRHDSLIGTLSRKNEPPIRRVEMHRIP